MNRRFLSAFLLFALSGACAAAQAKLAPSAEPCEQAFKHGSAAVLKAQQSLMQQHIAEMDEAVTPVLQKQIAEFKDVLVSAADVILHCESADTPADQLQKDLAKQFHANQPDNSQTQLPYGAELKVSVATPAAAPQLRIVEIHFDIECGDDAVLLVYEPDKGVKSISMTGARSDSSKPDGFSRTLRWQAQPYDQISGAFGGFFKYLLLPAQASKPWRLVVAHGTDWCTSRWSGYGIDLIEPYADAPRVIWHDQQRYVRETDPKLTLRPNGFELRVDVGTIETEQMVRKGVFHYAVDGDTVRRTQPIAVDGRGFVDEWLQYPWDEAKDWVLPEGLAGFKAAHDAFERGRKDSSVTYSYGPVRACTMKGQYEVEIDAEPGGKQFYAIREGNNGYTLEIGRAHV